nr:hypothetical protein [Mycoplasmopsis bovis]
MENVISNLDIYFINKKTKNEQVVYNDTMNCMKISATGARIKWN